VEAAITTLVPISITNTTISNSISWGLAHVVADDTDYATSNTFVDNADGDIIAFDRAQPGGSM